MSLNWYRNAHFFESNNAKSQFKQLVASQVSWEKIQPPYLLEIDFMASRSNQDLGNFCAIAEKFTMDALIELGLIEEDNITVHTETRHRVIGKEKEWYFLVKISQNSLTQ